jgi:MOSC domain-containing protein YiiM
MPKRRRSADALPIITVSGRFLRFPSAGHGTFERSPIARADPIIVAVPGLQHTGACDWSTDPTTKNLRTKDMLDRAVMFQSEAHYPQILAHFKGGKGLRSKLPKKVEPGGFGENVTFRGACAETLCIGDVLEIVPPDRATRTEAGPSSPRNSRRGSTLTLQVTSPRRPCAKVDHSFGQTWDGGGVRAHTAMTARAGIFCKVLVPGALTDGAHLAVTERPYPQWPVARVAASLYGMEGACANPKGYTLPHGGTGRRGAIGLGGGRETVERLWRGTEAELRELAAMPELALLEWRDEFMAMVDMMDGRTTTTAATAAQSGAHESHELWCTIS